MANKNAITKIQLKTKTSKSAQIELSEINLDQGEPLVNIEDKTLIIGTENGNAASDNAIILGRSRNEINSNTDSNSITLAHYDGNCTNPISTHTISGNDNLRLEIVEDAINVAYTPYSSHLIFEKRGTSDTEYKVAGILSGAGSKVRIPCNYNGKPVTAIDFSRDDSVKSGIKSIKIPDSVIDINFGKELQAFQFESLKLPHTLSAVQNIPSCVKYLSVPASYIQSSKDFRTFTNLNQLIISNVTETSDLDLEEIELNENTILKISGLGFNPSKLKLPATSTSLTLIIDADMPKTSSGLSTITNISNLSKLVFSNKVRNIPEDIAAPETRASCTLADLPRSVNFIGANAFSGFTNLPANLNTTPDQELTSVVATLSSSDNESDARVIDLTLPGDLKISGTISTNKGSLDYNSAETQIVGESLDFIYAITQTNGHVEAERRKITIAEGDGQGQLKINGNNYTIKGLSAGSDSSFSSITDVKSITGPSGTNGNGDQLKVGSTGELLLYAGEGAQHINIAKGTSASPNSESINLSADNYVTIRTNCNGNESDNKDSASKFFKFTTAGNFEVGYSDDKISAWGQVKAGSFNAMSDARLKENFQPLSSGKSILDLPTYKFNFIGSSDTQIGCKAQDLQEICPEIVNEDADGYLSIQESKIVYLLLEEVKKLREEINELRGW